MPKGHVHLRPLPPGRKRLFWAGVTVVVLLVTIGWILSISQVLSLGAERVREHAGNFIEYVGEEIAPVGEQATNTATGQVSDFTQTIQEIKDAYEQLEEEQHYAEEETNKEID